jgi:hypothetical protein
MVCTASHAHIHPPRVFLFLPAETTRFFHVHHYGFVVAFFFFTRAGTGGPSRSLTLSLSLSSLSSLTQVLTPTPKSRSRARHSSRTHPRRPLSLSHISLTRGRRRRRDTEAPLMARGDQGRRAVGERRGTGRHALRPAPSDPPFTPPPPSRTPTTLSLSAFSFLLFFRVSFKSASWPPTASPASWRPPPPRLWRPWLSPRTRAGRSWRTGS